MTKLYHANRLAEFKDHPYTHPSKPLPLPSRSQSWIASRLRFFIMSSQGLVGLLTLCPTRGTSILLLLSRAKLKYPPNGTIPGLKLPVPQDGSRGEEGEGDWICPLSRSRSRSQAQGWGEGGCGVSESSHQLGLSESLGGEG